MEMVNFYDAWTEAQKTFTKNLVNTQKDIRTQWLNAVVEMQETMNSFPGVKDNAQAKDAVKLYNTWFDNAVDTTKAMGEEVSKVQTALQAALEKQYALGRQVVTNFADLTKTATKTVNEAVVKAN
ncbi:MAG: hypothetical protein VW238_05015 [Nitrosomonadales bacterium]|jgi:RNA polymerase-binding transcription factor DksA